MACAEEPVDPDVDLHVRAQRTELDVTFLAAISLGGVLGSLARQGIGDAWPARTGFPWSTLCVNSAGCVLIGILMVTLTELIARPHRLARPFLGVGVLGGFTTFSAYSVDIVHLVEAGRTGVAMTYLVATPAVAVAAVTCGVRATRAARAHLAGATS